MEGQVYTKKPLKRLCVFYKDSANYIGKPVEWIVCKKCQKGLRRGTLRNLGRP